MKQNKKSSLIIIILLLAVGVTSSYVASTYAKYTSDLGTKEGTATVAKWNFSSSNGSTFDIALDGTYDPNTLVSGKIAPGTKGSFNIALSNTGSEVGATYEITIGEGTNIPNNLKFYTAYTNENTNTPVTSNIITGTLNPNATKTITIYWVWAYETGTGNALTTNDSNDTSAGTSAYNGNATMTIPVTITGTQVTPTGS